MLEQIPKKMNKKDRHTSQGKLLYRQDMALLQVLDKTEKMTDTMFMPIYGIKK